MAIAGALPDPLPIERLDRPFDQVIAPPGSKSITNRAYVLAALAEGETRVRRPLRALDCDLLLEALATLGAEVIHEGEDVRIVGVAGRFPRGGRVNLGDGGTPTRFMIAAACLAAEPVEIDGSSRMRERPVAEGVELLRRLGARIEYVEAEGSLPVRVIPVERLRGGTLSVGRTASSQFVSALMLIAPWLPDGLELHHETPPTSASYLRLTESVIASFSRDYAIEPDASSAVYWHAAASLVPGARTRVPGLGGLQPDERAIAALPGNDGEETRGPDAFRLGAIDAALWPDGSLVLAAVAARALTPTTITGLHTLRVKETDRIAALANELRRVGCAVEATEDAIVIDPAGAHDDPVVIETYDDHRMAMSFAVLGLARGGIAIADPGCVAKSYPGFWDDLARLSDGGGA